MDPNYILSDNLPEIDPQKSNGSSQSNTVSINDHNDHNLPVSYSSPPVHQTTGYQPFGKKLSSVTFQQCPLRSFTTVNIATLWVFYIPMILISSSTQNTYQCLAYNLGAMYPPAVNGANLQYYRYIMSMFLTSGFGMILICTIFLFICSYPLEKYYGKWKFMFFYLMSGFGGNIFQQFLSPTAITVAVTQCIFGMIPLVIGYILTNQGATILRKLLMMTAVLMILLFQQILKSSTTRYGIFLDHSSQLGGLATGILLTVIFLKLKLRNWENIQAGAKVLLPFILIAFFIYNQIAKMNEQNLGEFMCRWI